MVSNSRRGPRRRALVTAAAAIAGGLMLSSCGADLHPGTVATVDGVDISRNSVDDLVEAACHYIAKQSEGGDSAELTVSTVRANVAGAEVAFRLVDSAATDLGLTVRDSDVQAIASQTPDPEGLSDSDTDLLKTFFYDSARAQLQQATIGAHLTDETVTTSAGVSLDSITDSDEYIRDYFKDADIDVNPIYGVWSGTDISAESGSLSRPVSARAQALSPAEADAPLTGLEPPADEASSDVPANQKCG